MTWGTRARIEKPEEVHIGICDPFSEAQAAHQSAKSSRLVTRETAVVEYHNKISSPLRGMFTLVSPSCAAKLRMTSSSPCTKMGLDGFWIHRVLQNEGIESHVVDPASIATSRRERRPNVRLIWRGNSQVVQLGSDLGCRNSHWSLLMGD